MTRAANMHLAFKAATAAAFAITLAGCASSYGEKSPDTPGWFKSKVKETEKEPFPELTAVPDATPSTKSQNEWDAIEKDAKAAGTEINSSPRSAEADQTPADIEAFEAESRKQAEGKSTGK